MNDKKEKSALEVLAKDLRSAQNDSYSLYRSVKIAYPYDFSGSYEFKHVQMVDHHFLCRNETVEKMLLDKKSLLFTTPEMQDPARVAEIFTHEDFHGSIAGTQSECFVQKNSGKQPEPGLGFIDKAKEIILCTDYPSAVAISEATRKPVVCCMTPWNMRGAAEAFHKRNPEAKIHLCMSLREKENDNSKEYNTKLDQRIGASIHVPSVTASERSRGHDTFYALWHDRGLESVRKQLGELCREKGKDKEKGQERM